MQKRKMQFYGTTQFAMRFFYISLFFLFLIMALNFYVMWIVLGQLEESLHISSMFKCNFIISQVCLTVFLAVVFIGGILILHRTIGPLNRMERNLDEVLKGDRSVRIHVRDKDMIQSFVSKLNKVLDLLPR